MRYATCNVLQSLGGLWYWEYSDLMKTSTQVSLSVLSALTLLQFGCGDGLGPQLDTQPDERLSITNDEAVLNARVRYLDQDVPYLDEDVPVDEITEDSEAWLTAGRIRGSARGFSLRLVAEVSPPSIDGYVLQATSIAMKGNKAIVSYAMRGETYMGGIDVFRTSERKTPRLRSQALFRDTDIHSVSVHGDYVYIAEATADGAYPYPAVLEMMRLQDDRLVGDYNERMLLTSYAGTAVLGTGSTIYVTSGDNGGLSVFDQSTMTMTNSVPLHDARWVDVVDGKVVVVQGTPGRISVFDEGSMELLGSYPFTGSDIAESKSTVQIVGGKAFIAAGNGGVQILSVNTGKVVGTVPLPDSDVLGLDWSGVMTNAVAVDDDLLFISNGIAGVYVAQGSRDFDETGSEEPLFIRLLGRLRFDNLEPANHVAYKDHYLVIASGQGGIKTVEIRVDD